MTIYKILQGSSDIAIGCPKDGIVAYGCVAVEAHFVPDGAECKEAEEQPLLGAFAICTGIPVASLPTIHVQNNSTREQCSFADLKRAFPTFYHEVSDPNIADVVVRNEEDGAQLTIPALGSGWMMSKAMKVKYSEFARIGFYIRSLRLCPVSNGSEAMLDQFKFKIGKVTADRHFVRENEQKPVLLVNKTTNAWYLTLLLFHPDFTIEQCFPVAGNTAQFCRVKLPMVFGVRSGSLRDDHGNARMVLRAIVTSAPADFSHGAQYLADVNLLAAAHYVSPNPEVRGFFVVDKDVIVQPEDLEAALRHGLMLNIDWTAPYKFDLQSFQTFYRLRHLLLGMDFYHAWDVQILNIQVGMRDLHLRGHTLEGIAVTFAQKEKDLRFNVIADYDLASPSDFDLISPAEFHHSGLLLRSGFYTQAKSSTATPKSFLADLAEIVRRTRWRCSAFHVIIILIQEGINSEADLRAARRELSAVSALPVFVVPPQLEDDYNGYVADLGFGIVLRKDVDEAADVRSALESAERHFNKGRRREGAQFGLNLPKNIMTQRYSNNPKDPWAIKTLQNQKARKNTQLARIPSHQVVLLTCGDTHGDPFTGMISNKWTAYHINQKGETASFTDFDWEAFTKFISIDEATGYTIVANRNAAYALKYYLLREPRHPWTKKIKNIVFLNAVHIPPQNLTFAGLVAIFPFWRIISSDREIVDWFKTISDLDDRFQASAFASLPIDSINTPVPPELFVSTEWAAPKLASHSIWSITGHHFLTFPTLLRTPLSTNSSKVL